MSEKRGPESYFLGGCFRLQGPDSEIWVLRKGEKWGTLCPMRRGYYLEIYDEKGVF